MRQPNERGRRTFRFRIATATMVCLALFLIFPSWALAAPSNQYIPPNRTDVSGTMEGHFPDNSIPEEKQPHSDFYIIVPTIIPDHDHDTDAGKQVLLTVIVTDKATGKPIPGVRVEIQDPDRLGVPSITGSREEFHMTDKNGTLQIALFPDSKRRYQIAIHQLGYQPYKGRPFTVEASQEMRIELIPSMPIVSPPAIATAPGVKPPSGAITAPPGKKHESTKSKKRSKKRYSFAATAPEEAWAQEETPTQPAIEEEAPPEEPYQPSWDYVGSSGEASEEGKVHWFILVCAILTGLAGGGRVWRIRKNLKEMEFQDELKRRY